MKLYKFARSIGSAVAVSSDKDGGNLPARSSPWLPFGTVDVHPDDEARIGASGKDILAAVEEDGYMILGEGNA